MLFAIYTYIGIIDSANDSLFSYGANESWSDFYSPDFAPIFEVDFNSSSISVESFDICEGDLFCIFDIAATGNMAIGLTTLSGGQELEMINTLSAPGLSLPGICHLPLSSTMHACMQILCVHSRILYSISESSALAAQVISVFPTVVCDPPCGMGVCMPNNTCQCPAGYIGENCSTPGT